MNFSVQLFLAAIIIYGERITFAHEPVCVKFGQNLTTCGSSSTWALGTPNLAVDHVVNARIPQPFVISYFIQSTYRHVIHCQLTVSNETCGPMSSIEADCQCVNVSDDSVRVKILITEQNTGLTTLNYAIRRRSQDILTLHHFKFKECSLKEGDAVAVKPSNNPCGYGCTSRFKCPDTHEDLEEDQCAIYRCNAAAFWEPVVPTCARLPQKSTQPEDAGCGGYQSSFVNHFVLMTVVAALVIGYIASVETGAKISTPGVVMMIALAVCACISAIATLTELMQYIIEDHYRFAIFGSIFISISGVITWIMMLRDCTRRYYDKVEHEEEEN